MKQIVTHNRHVKIHDKTTTSSNPVSPHVASNFNNIQRLHTTIGNQAVLNLRKSGVLQPMLKISQSGDKYEREANRVADQVVRLTDSQLQCHELNEPKHRIPFRTTASISNNIPVIQCQPDTPQENRQSDDTNSAHYPTAEEQKEIQKLLDRATSESYTSTSSDSATVTPADKPELKTLNNEERTALSNGS